ncbi:MAG: S6e family ribosomal protein [Nanoarchaeota archaeon]|nr:S6e family ribosomal protein [Nanoarchaeota archaeon]
MAFKINIGDKSGKTYKLESEAPALIDKEIKTIIQGEDVSQDLEGYEFEISGASDKSGFPALDTVEGIGLKRVLLKYGKGMKKRPKYEGKLKRSNNKPKGLRLRKGIRGKIISSEISQINLKVLKVGKKSLEEIFNPKTEKVKEEKK